MSSLATTASAARPFADLSSRLKRGRIHQLLQQRSFRAAYQPLFSLADNRIQGVEGLTRVQLRPYRSPDVWFREAYEIGLGLEMELETLAVALEGLRLFPPHLFLAVNVSAELLMDDRLAPLLNGTDAGRLVLELTEHTPVDDYSSLKAALCPLRERGARMAIDDVGAGYANMQHILNLRPDFIKIDASLTRNIHLCSSRTALVAGLVQFARTFGTQIVAEGIEVAPQLETLRGLGIDFGQGYLMGRPLLIRETQS
jgi:EAL domain-containing protein (putative c-di-GMP-specific phosphodiesterase class I)